MDSPDAAATDDQGSAVQPRVGTDRAALPVSTLPGRAAADVGPGADPRVDPGRLLCAATTQTPASSATHGCADSGVEPGEQAIDRLAAGLRRLPVVVISGAGLSTESGIPAYRDRHGRWQQPAPIQHRDFLTAASVRQRYWARSFVGWPRIGLASPAAGHRVLRGMEQLGIVSTVITQNVDGLHQKAHSGFRLADYAHRQGKPVLAINRGVTRADHFLELKIDGECGAVLEVLALAMQRPAQGAPPAPAGGRW